MYMKKKSIIWIACLAAVCVAVVGLILFFCLRGDQGSGTEDPAESETDTVGTDQTSAPDESVIGSDAPDESVQPQDPADTEATVDTKEPGQNENGSSPESETESSSVAAPDSPADPETDPPASTVNPNTALLYEEYFAMSSEEQVAHFNSFANVEDFFAWYNMAKADYAERHPDIEIGPDGSIPLP
jgi:hypothetical protein